MPQSENPSSGSSITPQSNTIPTSNNDDHSLQPERKKKNFKLLVVGSAFVVMSAIITRRGVYRRQLWAKPTFFRQNHQHPEQKVDASLEALEALSVATVNVFSWSMFFAGGMLWAFEISNLQDLRSRFRVGLGVTEEEQRGSQAVVREWIQAAKPWNFRKSQQSTAETDGSNADGSSADGTSEGSASS